MHSRALRSRLRYIVLAGLLVGVTYILIILRSKSGSKGLFHFEEAYEGDDGASDDVGLEANATTGVNRTLGVSFRHRLRQSVD